MLIYVPGAMGLNVTVHFCAGKISAVDFGGHDEQSCACGKMGVKKSCCRDLHLAFRSDNQEQANHQGFYFEKIRLSNKCCIPGRLVFTRTYGLIIGDENHYCTHSPPKNFGSLYLRCRVLKL
jgi:hypothetical protein